SSALVIGCVINIAGAFIDCGLRVWTKRARSHYNAATYRLLRKDNIRRDTLLDPVHQHIEQVLRLRSRASSAMRDARSPEQAIESLETTEVRLAILPVTRGHQPVIVDHSAWHD